MQPAVNFDAVGPSDPAWIVAHRQAYLQDIVYATVSWSGGIPSLSPWTILATPAFGNPPFGPPPPIPSKGAQHSLIADYGVLTSASIRNSQLWTCRTVAVNGTGGATSADRMGCEWFRLSLTGTNAAVADQGRVYDNGQSNFRFYFLPSIVANSAGDMMMGFSGCGNNDYIGAFCAGRLAADPLGQVSPVKLLAPGEDFYDPGVPRWGDYSHTSLDPITGLGFWTIQEYARAPGSAWQTWIGEIIAVKQ